MNNEDQTVVAENVPRPFVEIPKLWLQLNRMSESFFAEEIHHTSIRNTFLGVLVYTVIASIVPIILVPLTAIVDYFTNLPTKQGTLVPALLIIVPYLWIYLCFGIIVYPLSFYLSNGITYISALIFGGKGKFAAQAYLGSLFIVPLGLIASATSFILLIPKVGIISYALKFVIALFIIFFIVRSFKVVHDFTTTKAVVAVVAPLLLLLIPIVMIGTLMFMGPVIGNVFSTINSNFGTQTP